MPLEIVADHPGLWRDPGWAASMPGVYALVAGVSAYAHLAGGSRTPAPDGHGLEQLVSSASTAAGIFDWLQQSFRRRDLPVVWCQLLLAPTPEERAGFEARGLRHYVEPTYRNLQDAIQLWTGNLPQAAAAARAGARVAMVGCVGDDAAGAALREGLERAGVDTSRVRVLAGET